MRKTLNILLITVSIAIIGFVTLTFLGISIVGTKTDSEYFKKRVNSSQIESKRILYVHAEDSLDTEMITNKVPFKLNISNKNDIINYNYIRLPDSFENGNSYFNTKTSTLYYGEAEYKKTITDFFKSEKLSKQSFDFYELKEPDKALNNFILFNEDYGILSCESRKFGFKYLFLPEQVGSDELQNKIIKVLYEEQFQHKH